MREIALDTETTGLNPKGGDRIVEIGCVEMINHVATGENLQLYINPERDMPEEAFKVHGLSNEFLADKPVFAAVADQFLDFIGDANLVIHNAVFDMGFLNAELDALGRTTIPMDRSIDTVALARKKFPGAPASLDALCRKYQIDNSNRTLHGALLDAELLAEVYLELKGGRQQGLSLAPEAEAKAVEDSTPCAPLDQTVRKARPHAPTDDELAAHQTFLDGIDNPIWSEA